jgi:hypothetical protein
MKFSWTQYHNPDRYDGLEYVTGHDATIEPMDGTISAIYPNSVTGVASVRFIPQWPGNYRFVIIAQDDDGVSEKRVDVLVHLRESAFDIKGIVFSAYWDPNRSYGSLLDQVVEDGGQYLQILPVWYMPDVNSTEIRPLPEVCAPGCAGVTMSDQSLATLISAARGRGLSIFLKPLLEFDNYPKWGGDLQPSDWDRWFDSYTRFIVHYARIAAENDVALFCIGAELQNSHIYTQKWREVIRAARDAYSHKITYSDAGVLGSGISSVEFWGDLDYLGFVWYCVDCQANHPLKGTLCQVIHPPLCQVIHPG